MNKKIPIKIKKIPGVNLPTRAHEDDAAYDIVATSDPIIVGKPSWTGGGFYTVIDYIEYETNLFLEPVIGTYNTLVSCIDGKTVNTITSFDDFYHILIFPRSSISKYNLLLCNSVGIGDNGYRGMYKLRFKYIFQPQDLRIISGEIGCRIDFEKIYKKHDKIGQLMVNKNASIEWIWADALNTTNRNTGGFGSTTERSKE